ncbi:MAG: IS200/IS605 family transposase [Thermodesulfovibrio sp.]|nr:IS200/IS605 family transposase [Thermodesulfovibrio sp.]
MKYIKDNHRVHLCVAHIVFCPKYRKPILVGEIKERCEQLILELAKEKKWEILNLTVQSDHVHIFIRFNPDESPHKVVKAIKGRTSNRLRKEFPELVTKLPTLWTRSYFVATAGNVSQDIIQEYIENQKGK